MSSWLSTNSHSGLSPRGRGKLDIMHADNAAKGSIPAWAGETTPLAPAVNIAEVYPRVGGGNGVDGQDGFTPVGLSPRGRGKQLAPGSNHLLARSIPAWAGETSISCSLCQLSTVYPRVGGGNQLICGVGITHIGLSPRGRGKLNLDFEGIAPVGSIPAWAGETPVFQRKIRCFRVYPRVGGGNITRNSLRGYHRGLSPRGRGKPLPPETIGSTSRSIPAWAGETRQEERSRGQRRVYPRVGGGNELRRTMYTASCGLSPRGRGKLGGKRALGGVVWSIPAWAGETSRATY